MEATKDEKFNTFYRIEGHYDLLHPSNKSAKYVFRLLEDAPKPGGSFLVDIDEDFEFDPEHYSALELAYELKTYHEKRWNIGSRNKKKEIDDLIKYLETRELVDERIKCRNKINYWQNKLNELDR